MKILLVSADKILRHTLHQTLSRHGFIVDLATDGEDAWDLLQAFMYDLVLLEALLPRLDGVSFCRRLRDVGNPILALLMTEAQPSEHCEAMYASHAARCASSELNSFSNPSSVDFRV